MILVKCQPDGTQAVSCLVMSPSQSLASHLMVRMNIAWTSGHRDAASHVRLVAPWTMTLIRLSRHPPVSMPSI